MNNTTLIKKLKALHVPKNTSLPVLKKVLIECKNDVLHFTTTDLDTQTSFHVPFDYAGFTALVDHKELISILSSLPKNTEVAGACRVF